MIICELCTFSNADFLVWIQNSHPLSDKRVLMYLCNGCKMQLESERVKLKVIKVLEHNDETPKMAKGLKSYRNQIRYR
jgi:hypothetical protein